MRRSSKTIQQNKSKYPQEIYANELSISYNHCQKLKQPEFKCLNSAATIADLLRDIWNADDLSVRESFYLLCFSQPLDLIGFYKLSEGGLDAVVVDTRLLFSAALLCRASSIIIAHNHPSGALSPSKADIAITRRIQQGGDMLSIKLLDHIILTPEDHYSFAENGGL